MKKQIGMQTESYGEDGASIGAGEETHEGEIKGGGVRGGDNVKNEEGEGGWKEAASEREDRIKRQT